MSPSRRTVLATTGAAFLAGCSRLRGNDAGTSFRERDLVDLTKTVDIGAGEYWSVEFSFDTQTVLLYSLVADDQVDALLFARDSFERYRADVQQEDQVGEIPYIGELSDLNTSATAQGSAVTAGEPVLVVDNTTWGSASPAETVKAKIEVEAFVRPERYRNRESPNEREQTATPQSSA